MEVPNKDQNFTAQSPLTLTGETLQFSRKQEEGKQGMHLLLLVHFSNLESENTEKKTGELRQT